jgi:hypothetical protein
LNLTYTSLTKLFIFSLKVIDPSGTICKIYNNIIGASVAEWLRLLTSNHLLLTAVGLNPDRDFGFFHVRSYPASLQNVGGSTQVPEIMHGGAPDVFLHQ